MGDHSLEDLKNFLEVQKRFQTLEELVEAAEHHVKIINKAAVDLVHLPRERLTEAVNVLDAAVRVRLGKAPRTRPDTYEELLPPERLSRFEIALFQANVVRHCKS